MASISYFGFTGNEESQEDNFEGFFEESSGWATISNWLERQVEILNNSVRMKCSAFDHISNEIPHFSLEMAPRSFLKWTSNSMEIYLNRNRLRFYQMNLLSCAWVICGRRSFDAFPSTETLFFIPF